MTQAVTAPQLSVIVQALPERAIIGIEGFMESGKSFLADQLATASRTAVIHLDQFVTAADESLPYADRLDYSAISTQLSALKKQGLRVVLEGICLRIVASRLSTAPSLYVYVKRISPVGVWNDGINLEDFKEDLKVQLPEPERSDVAYHASALPHEIANYIYERSESPSAA